MFHSVPSPVSLLRPGSLLSLTLRACQVDIVFNGHVHAYERTYPISQNHTDCASGVPFITIGDGGNREMFAVPWGGQPEWSALREYAYGHGELRP